jgi:hypothetical protein
MLYWSIFCLRIVKYCSYEALESALCLTRSMALRYLLSKISLCLAMKPVDQFLPGSDPHKTEAQRVTVAGVGGRHHSDSLLICSTSASSCLLLNSRFDSALLAKEPVFPWNRLLRVLLFTLNFLATSAIGN